LSGATLGLLMQRWPEEEGPFGPLTSFAERVSDLARFAGMEVAVFAPGDVDLVRSRVRGSRCLGRTGGWRQADEALPPVVWNRYFGRDEGLLLQAMESQGVSSLNAPGLSKWEAHLCLSDHPLLLKHLPETRMLTDASVALELLDRHSVIFFKPVNGSVGRGIIRVSRDGSGFLRLEYVSAETGAMTEQYAGAGQLGRWLAREGRAGRYIVQQGLDLAIFHGRPADVRILVQKDGSGRWQLTGMGARVAADGRFTTNLHTGGSGLPVERLAEAVFPRDGARQEDLIDQLEMLALAAACRLEDQTGPMGEVGLDFGIDTDGNIWYIEQNAQPGRSIFEHLGRWDLSDLAHLRPIQYAAQLVSTKCAKAAGDPST
jgi:hypothetical protein